MHHCLAATCRPSPVRLRQSRCHCPWCIRWMNWTSIIKRWCDASGAGLASSGPSGSIGIDGVVPALQGLDVPAFLKNRGQEMNKKLLTSMLAVALLAPFASHAQSRSSAADINPHGLDYSDVTMEIPDYDEPFQR